MRRVPRTLGCSWRGHCSLVCKFFLEACDGKFTDDLNDEGNAFAHVQDTWTNFDKLRPVLNKRFDDWRRSRQ
jgi:hypothetical protein